MRIELNGTDISDEPGTYAQVDMEVGRRTTAKAGILLPDGSALSDPADFQRLLVEHPGVPYRSAALALDPWLYWPLDEGLGLDEADDISGNDRDGTYSTAGGAVLRRRVEAEGAAVPYGGAPRFEAGAAPGVTGPALTGLGVAITVSAFVRIDHAAAGSADIIDLGHVSQRLWRTAIDVTAQRISWRVRAQTLTTDVAPDRWLWIVGTRSASTLSLYVDGELIDSAAVTQPTIRIDDRTGGVDVADGTLDSEVDEVAVWDRALTAAEITTLQEARESWRAFSGETYGIDVQMLPSARQFTLPAVDSTMRLDRSELLGVFASPNPTAAGAVMRAMLAQLDPPWAGTTYGVDLDTLIDRLVERGGPGSAAIDRVSRLAEAVEWSDPWDDLHLDRRETTHLLDVTLTEEDFQPGWKPRYRVERFRTRTVARGGGVSGGFDVFAVEGDGSTTRWVIGQQVREVVVLLVAGVAVGVGGSGDTWEISDDGLELITTGGAPAVGTRIKLEYEVEAPLTAIAEDTPLPTGHIVRSIEDRSIDDPETLAELARVTQGAHGQIGVEISADLYPSRLPTFIGVGGSPTVSVRGFTGRMTIMRLRTTFVSAGELILQHVVLRAHDISTELDYYRAAQIPQLQLPSPEPVIPPPQQGIVVGQKLPHPLGGDWQTYESGTTWADVPGFIEVDVDWRIYADVTLAVNFMAQIDIGGADPTTETARVRLRDVTRSVTLGVERTVSGAGPQPYNIGDIIPPQGIGRSKVRLQHRRVNADVVTWGGEIDIDLG